MKSHCSTCKFCKYAQEKPESLIGKIWKWHTKWCPCWKSYQKELAEERSKVEDEV